MGNSAVRPTDDLEVSKITVDFDVESPSCSGLKSVLSQPLDEYIDYDTLWSGLIKLLKDPPKHGLLTKTELKEICETEFSTRNFFSVGSFGKLLGFEDFQTVEHVRVDYAAGDIKSERYDQNDNLVQTTYTKIHREPLRVESWFEVPQVRIADRAVSIMAKDSLTRGRQAMNPSGSSEGAIVMTPDAESLSGDGQKSAVSDPLDDHFADLDQLFKGWIAAAKQSPNWEEQQKGDLPKVNKFEVKEISESEFNTITVVDGDSLDKGFDTLQRVATPVDSLLAFRSTGDRTTISVYICDRSKAEICNQVFNHHGTLVMSVFCRFYEDPLRVEVWVEQAQARRSGRIHCVMVWTFLSKIIQEFKQASVAMTGELENDL
eukprot:CAMPEP_0171162546 /NCGR_PEP_ID=MMETSP0790-20130122/4647_1 /TAXON_ID=2925 /ORGANISM="Alexandrium catenella, Strain OF101" /LENGTH=374 /DNA_ID=CAMNT_0011627151 /DNA_START=13 /DNA_END=1137 /DNA_ORIENTATION=-